MAQIEWAPIMVYGVTTADTHMAVPVGAAGFTACWGNCGAFVWTGMGEAAAMQAFEVTVSCIHCARLSPAHVQWDTVDEAAKRASGEPLWRRRQ